MRYAQINKEGICFADSFLAEEIIAEDMILLSENEPSPLGKKYTNGKWMEIEQQEPASQPISDTEMIMQSLADIELILLERGN